MATATTSIPTAIELPEWVINVHNFRKRLFMQIVEPVIVYLLGPVEEEEDYTYHEHNYFHHEQSSSSFYNPFQTNNIFSNQNYDHGDALDHHNPNILNPHLHHDDIHGRRLNFLPDYVEDATAFRETAMSFATLAMLFTIMTCVMIVFLSCFYHNQMTSPLFISPRRHRLPNLVPPPLPVDGTFSWIKVCFYIDDEEVRVFILIFWRMHVQWKMCSQ